MCQHSLASQPPSQYRATPWTVIGPVLGNSTVYNNNKYPANI